ncbi:RagB/SusD family nutrient uptake outer membrane protein [Filimonas effusa]|uniref:RagB/SusD family nutrient uptake outer membrane protein n=1 Tax=Filimonas effusa TaxID=2508721 RepID=A0A4V1MAD3_9BACT|nr:RagB/SusD family nutrient uptake outer membrane protein [Filimonas effusa]RXK85476.1 RagB/SusD family nutrient uptake outer membrane protein [Filimonas effusa]
MQAQHIKSLIYSCLTLGILMAGTGCSKFLEPDYKTNVTTDVIFSSDGNAQAAINGVYATMANNQTTNGEITRSTGMAADELSYYTASIVYDQFASNNLLVNNDNLNTFWVHFYSVIYQSNSIIENAGASSGLSAAFQKQIIGEAYFLRAFSHFYLVNLFGPVPLITTIEKNVTLYAPRASEADVYTQIKADLVMAMNNLPADYTISGGKRTRANKWAAAALLARVYLYTKDWANAEAMATQVLANTGLYKIQATADINKAFQNGNSESILELDRTPFSNYTNEGSAFVTTIGTAAILRYPMNTELVSSFESGDLRKTNWILQGASVSTPSKYKLNAAPATAALGENYLLLRVAELYLIRAEAKVQQDNFTGGADDINVIRNRAGLKNSTTMTDRASSMLAIENERRHELFCEWGHRWFDLKRWPGLTAGNKTRADDILGKLKAGWKTTATLFPIPQIPRSNNPNLTQNDGYN